MVPLINDLYRTWGLLHNFFSPTLKLEKKVREGSKTKRTYGQPETPYQRLLNSPNLTAEQKAGLQALSQNSSRYKAVFRQLKAR